MKLKLLIVLSVIVFLTACSPNVSYNFSKVEYQTLDSAVKKWVDNIDLNKLNIGKKTNTFYLAFKSDKKSYAEIDVTSDKDSVIIKIQEENKSVDQGKQIFKVTVASLEKLKYLNIDSKIYKIKDIEDIT